MRRVSRAAFAVFAALTAAAAYAQTVDEIIAKNLQAKGGAEKWKSVSSLKMTGKVTMQGMELPVTVYAKRPNYMRQELTLNAKQVVQAFDGTRGWAIPPNSDVAQELPREISDMMKNTADFGGVLIDYKQKGHTVELVGKEKVEGVEAFHLKVTTKSGYEQHYYLDANTGFEVKTVVAADLGAGQKQTIESLLSNFQNVNGIMFPHALKQVVNGQAIVQMTIDKVELNAPVDDAQFRMPVK